MNHIEHVYGFQNPSIINQQNFNLSFEMYSLQQNLKNHIDYSFKRLCSDLHQMFPFSRGKSKFEKDTFETASKERFYQYDNHKLNSLESEMRLNKRQTKPCKYATKCGYLSEDNCWFIHRTVDKVERTNQPEKDVEKIDVSTENEFEISNTSSGSSNSLSFMTERSVSSEITGMKE